MYTQGSIPNTSKGQKNGTAFGSWVNHISMPDLSLLAFGEEKPNLTPPTQ